MRADCAKPNVQLQWVEGIAGKRNRRPFGHGGVAHAAITAQNLAE